MTREPNPRTLRKLIADMAAYIRASRKEISTGPDNPPPGPVADVERWRRGSDLLARARAVQSSVR